MNSRRRKESPHLSLGSSSHLELSEEGIRSNMDANQLSGKASEVKDDLENRAQNVKERLQDTSREWGRRARVAVRNAGVTADEYVHENTWTTLALAAIVGCVIGVLLGRTRD
jgi:ElaB/YqjD/DUF883 family membrane-anchored ribosome-binding protein